MKSILPFLALACGLLAQAQPSPNLRDQTGPLSVITGGTAQNWLDKTQTAERTVEIPGHYYVVRYEYSPAVATIPAIFGAKSHYQADIEVFEVVDGSKLQIGKTFPGVYVDGGCFEDKPETLVKQALKSTGRLTPEIESAFEERDRRAEFEAQPLYIERDGVLTITTRGQARLKAIVVNGAVIWGAIPAGRCFPGADPDEYICEPPADLADAPGAAYTVIIPGHKP